MTLTASTPLSPASWRNGNSPGGKEMKNRTDITACFRGKRRRWRKAAQGTQASCEKASMCWTTTVHAGGDEPADLSREAGSAFPCWGKGDCPPLSRDTQRAPCAPTEGLVSALKPEVARKYHSPAHFSLPVHQGNNGIKNRVPSLWLRVSPLP